MTDEVRVLFVTTNDLADPIRGCDRRSRQLCVNMPDEWRVDSISYAKSGTDPDYSLRDSTDERHVRTDYPGRSALAPFNPAVFRRLFRERGRYDLVVSSAVGASLYGLTASLYHGVPLVTDVHNVDDKLSLEIGDYQRYLFGAVFGTLANRRASLVALTSATDREQFGPALREKSVVVANGFDAETFYRDNTEPDDRVLFFGNMSYEPNAEAVEVIADEIAPRLAEEHPELEIHLAGPDCDEITDSVEGLENVVVAGLVDDIASYIRESRVVIVPLLTGSGTRLKIIESLACGTPVVSTPKGAEGWPNDWNGLVEAPIPEFPSTVDQLFEIEIPDAEYETYLSYSWHSQVEDLVKRIRTRINPD
jgi:glycosyltransferase involved in cell wall biosynthesis